MPAGKRIKLHSELFSLIASLQDLHCKLLEKIKTCCCDITALGQDCTDPEVFNRYVDDELISDYVYNQLCYVDIASSRISYSQRSVRSELTRQLDYMAGTDEAYLEPRFWNHFKMQYHRLYMEITNEEKKNDQEGRA